MPGDGIQVAAVVAAGKRIADAQLEKLRLQLLSLRDVDENPVTVLLAGLRIDREKRTVDDRPHLSIATRELKLDVANRAIALEQRHLSGSHLGPDEIARTRTPQLFQRFDAKHFEEGGIRVDDLAVQRRDVNSFLQTQRELAERVGIAQVAETFLFSGLFGGLGTAHINASANGMSVASMEG